MEDFYSIGPLRKHRLTKRLQKTLPGAVLQTDGAIASRSLTSNGWKRMRSGDSYS